MRRSNALPWAFALCVSCSRAPTRGDSVIVAHITLGPGVTATCVDLAITDPSGNPLDDTRLLAASKTDFHVGIYQGTFPTSITLVARALQGASGCTDPTTIEAASNSQVGTFVLGEEQTVELPINCGTCQEADGGPQDAGRDGGSVAADGSASDGGPDAGADSGSAVDAGPLDSGAPDASPSDAGSIDAGPADAASAPDAAPRDAGPTLTLFLYPPSNFDPGSIPSSSISPGITLNCGVSTFNSGDGGYSNWCGQSTPTPVVVLQKGDAGPPVAILSTEQFTVGDAGTLQIIGDKPVIIAVFGSANVAGNIYVNASGADPGAGGGLNAFCGNSTGADGTTAGTGQSGGGGGGGAFSANGGTGGDTGAGGGTHGNGGQASSVPGPALVPLRGGCSGGIGGAQATASEGGGGGAVQMSAAGTLTLAGNVAAAGGGGAGGVAIASGVGSGGAGGGSGGAILFEGNAVVFSGSPILAVNGGGGGEGGGAAFANGNPGSPGSVADGTQAAGGSGGTTTAGPGGNGGAQAGGAGNGTVGSTQFNGGGGGGGGGGSAGVIRINSNTTCTAASSTPLFSPSASSNGKPGCP